MRDATALQTAPRPASDAPGPILEARGLRRRYGGRWVLDGIDLSLAPGSILGLLGRNGAGKSTLLRCLLGLAPTDGGQALVYGTPSWELGAVEKARLGYVAQTPRFQPWMTAQQMARYVGAFYPTWDDTLVAGLIARWEIPPTQRIGTLSPGEAQRLAIALALGPHPTLLIMDEPAASLDPGARRAVISAVLEAVASDGTAVLISSHLTSDLERLANRVAFMHGGRIVIDSDLDLLKDTVKRLHIRCDQLPGAFAVPGMLHCERRPDGALVTVRLLQADQEAPLVADLQARYHAAVVVEQLSLEDIFLAVDQ